MRPTVTLHYVLEVWEQKAQHCSVQTYAQLVERTVKLNAGYSLSFMTAYLSPPGKMGGSLNMFVRNCFGNRKHEYKSAS